MKVLPSSFQTRPARQSTIHYSAPTPSWKTLTKTKKIQNRIFQSIALFFFPIVLLKVAKQALHILAGKFIVTSQLIPISKQKLRQGKENLLKAFSGKSIKIKTSTGTFLDGVHLYSPSKNKEKKTILMLGGALQLYEFRELKPFFAPDKKTKRSLKKEKFPYTTSNISYLLKKGYDIVLFNYSGCGQSTGHATFKRLKNDSFSVFSYVRNKCKVKEDQIYLFSHSLGGFSGNYLHYRFPKTKIWIDRSFSNISPIVARLFKRKIFSAFILKFLKLLGWKLNSLKYWEKGKGNRCLTYHKQDEIISLEASLAKSIKNKKETHSIPLRKYKKYEQVSYSQLKPLSKKHSWDISDKLLKIMPKLFSAHNRKLTKKEINRILNTFSPLGEASQL